MASYYRILLKIARLEHQIRLEVDPAKKALLVQMLKHEQALANKRPHRGRAGDVTDAPDEP